MEILPTASQDVIAFRRGEIVVIVNLSAEEQKLFNEKPRIGGMSEFFTGATEIPDTLLGGGYLVFNK